LDFIIDRGVS